MQKQFAAMTYRLPWMFYGRFEGRMTPLIGWKEDLHMTYMRDHVPA